MCSERPTSHPNLNSNNCNNNINNSTGYLNQSSYTFRVPGSSGSNSFLANNNNNNNHHQQQQQPTLSGHSVLSSNSGHQHEVVSVKPHSGFQSQVEQQLLAAKSPLEHLKSHEVVQAGQFRGVLLNKQELENWRGPVPLEQYRLHDDPCPEVIKKRMDKIKYTQEMGVRYLNPPPAPKPGDLIIRERQASLPPAPPLIIRQEGDRASSPPPLVYRECPPRPPARIPEQVIEVDACPAPPPPRRVIVERLSHLPQRPQDIIVEKWLPYRPQKRRVVYQRAVSCQQLVPRNLIIEWEAPEVEVVKQCKDLGVMDADPEDYCRRYGNELKQASELPTCEPEQSQQKCTNCSIHCPTNQNRMASASAASIASVRDNRCPIHFGNGSQYQNHGQQSRSHFTDSMPDINSSVPELEGDLQALKLVDMAALDRHGLSEYKNYLQNNNQQRHISL